MKIRGETIVRGEIFKYSNFQLFIFVAIRLGNSFLYIFKKFCGLRNGTVEAWGLRSLQREMALTEQEGSVQVRETYF